MILSLLKYSNEHANENTKEGQKNAPQGILFTEEALAMKCNGKTLRQRMPEGTGREIPIRGSRQNGADILLKAVRKEIQRIPIKRRKLFCSWEQGEELGAEITRRMSERRSSKTIPRYTHHSTSHTFLRKDKRQIQRIKTSRIPDPCRSPSFRSPMCQRKKRKKERGGPSVKAEKNGVRSAHPGRRHILRFLQ